MKTPTQIKLDEDIPESAITEREAYRGGPMLSYLTGGYVINRLNQVVGQGKWMYQLQSMKLVHEGTIKQASGEAFTTSYVATVLLDATVDGNRVAFTEVGYGDGTDKKSPGKAHELAVKEATTDALKRAAKNLGISMGLGLYFKDRDYEVIPSTTDTVTKAPVGTSVPASNNSTEQAGVNISASTTPAKKEKDPRTLIRSAFSVLQAQRKITKEDFTNKYLNGKTSKDLTDKEAKAVVAAIKTDFQELGL